MFIEISSSRYEQTNGVGALICSEKISASEAISVNGNCNKLEEECLQSFRQKLINELKLKIKSELKNEIIEELRAELRNEALGKLTLHEVIGDDTIDDVFAKNVKIGNVTETEKARDLETCNTKACHTIARYLQMNLNESVDPCDDFYEYACGNWSAQFPNPEGEDSWSVTEYKYRKEFGITELKRTLEHVGGCPMISSKWSNNNKTFENVYVYLDTLLSVQPFFDYTFEEDTEADFYNIEQLAKFSMDSDNFTDPEEYKEMSFNEMNEQFPGIDWFEIFNGIFSFANKNITKNETILVYNRYYFENLGNFLRNSSERVIANYFAWKVIDEFGYETVLEFQEKNGTEIGTEELKMSCYDSTEKMMKTAMNYFFIQNYFDQSSMKELDKFLRELKHALTLKLQKNQWMDLETKLNAQRKLNKMMYYIAAPQEVGREEDLNRIYEETGEISSENYSNAYKNLLKWEKKLRLSQPRKFDFLNEISPPSEVNAFNDLGANKILIATGMLMPPNYYRKGPLSVNFGGIGTTFGHEMVHGFDNEGSLYDERGVKRNWWSRKAKKNFRSKVMCFVRQYSNYREPITGQRIRGRKTVGDDIADNGGLHQAFHAYKMYAAMKHPERDLKLPYKMSKFTRDQLFFISYANTWCGNYSRESLIHALKNDEHSPASARVIIPLRNNKAFAKTFNCPINSPMNPEKKCKLW
ncbi:neprilysin-2-like protein, partial [Dinothrombium tinctorium]